jgi:AcrR family transcriptional regulator
LILNVYDDFMRTAQQRIHQAALQLFAKHESPRVTVSELAEAAGVARGTVYNNIGSVEHLFEEVATRLIIEMDSRIVAALATTNDPAQRVADGIRFFVRRAHEEPLWGRFLVRFGPTTLTLRGLLEGEPVRDIQLGTEIGRFHLRPDQVASAVVAMSGSVLGAISLVLEGHRTWRDAGSDTAELFLRALGIPAETALSLATSDLPPLPLGNSAPEERPRPDAHVRHGTPKMERSHERRHERPR